MSFSSSPAPKTTPVWDTYWRFAAERQRVFLRRLRGQMPHTADPILGAYRFTNVYRASDRVSQVLIRDVIYSGLQDPEEVFFRTLLFRFFNKPETWQLLQEKMGDLCCKNFCPSKYSRILSNAHKSGIRIFSAAYIMPSRGGEYTHPRKHENLLRVLQDMLSQRLPARLGQCHRPEEAFHLLLSFPMIGKFLAYQYWVDLNYGLLLDFSERDFIVAGPGARSGLRKCFSDPSGKTDEDLIRWVSDNQEREFQNRGLHFEPLGGRPLQLVDCQNIFCEIDKYSRVAHPEVDGTTDRSRIKQLYRQQAEPYKLWFPPKWRVNHKIAQDLRAIQG
jgi:hypothetical protein